MAAVANTYNDFNTVLVLNYKSDGHNDIFVA